MCVMFYSKPAGNNSSERHESKGIAQLAGRQHCVDQLEKTGKKRNQDIKQEKLG